MKADRFDYLLIRFFGESSHIYKCKELTILDIQAQAICFIKPKTTEYCKPFHLYMDNGASHRVLVYNTKKSMSESTQREITAATEHSWSVWYQSASGCGFGVFLCELDIALLQHVIVTFTVRLVLQNTLCECVYRQNQNHPRRCDY